MRRQRRRRSLPWRRHDEPAYDYLIVGCGFAGSVLAERLASQHGARILMIDKRDHVGGNAYDEKNADGILYHKYGPHIFHTNSDEIFDYLSQFTEWRPYEHRVLACVRDQLVPIPINRTTLNSLFDAGLEDRRGGRRLPRRAAPSRSAEIRTSRGRRHQRRRPRALRAVLPRLHAQAMGPRPERARQVGDRAHPDPDQHRRPLFHRQAPGHAARRLHARCSSACSTIRNIDDRARHRLSRRPRRGRRRPHHLHRAGRRIFRLALRQAALPHPALRASTIDKEQFQPVAVVNYPDRGGALHPDQRV